MISSYSKATLLLKYVSMYYETMYYAELTFNLVLISNTQAQSKSIRNPQTLFRVSRYPCSIFREQVHDIEISKYKVPSIKVCFLIIRFASIIRLYVFFINKSLLILRSIQDQTIKLSTYVSTLNISELFLRHFEIFF